MPPTKYDILVLVAASSVNTGPVKGILQFIQNIQSPDVQYHLYNFRQYDDPLPDPFAVQTLKFGIPCNFVQMGGHNYLLMIWDTVRAVKSKHITIIQTHGFKPTLIGFFIKFICRIKWVCFMHGTTSENWKVRLYNHIDSVLQLCADRVVLVAENQRNRILNGSNKQRVTVIHNAVNLYQPVQFSEVASTTRAALKVPASSILLAVVGRLSPEKGIDVFINAFSCLVDNGMDVYAVIVGDGQEKPVLESLAVTANCSERLFFVGHTATPGDYMMVADIIVLPSRSEGIPNVALEAMALGKPVVATAVGGTPEVIEHNKSGLLVPTERPDLMAQAIMQVINEPLLANKLTIEAAKRVQEHFSVEFRCNKLMGIYESL